MISSDRSEIRRQNSEYCHLLGSIQPLIKTLTNPRDAEHCLLWLAKLDEANPSEKIVRNKLLAELKQDVLRNQLRPPFSREPPDCSLTAFCQTSNATFPSQAAFNTSQRSFNRDSSQIIANGSTPHQFNVRVLHGPEAMQQRIRFLEEENRQLACKCQQLQSNGMNRQAGPGVSQQIQELEAKLCQSQQAQDQLMKRYQKELQDVICKKNEAISHLERQIREVNADSSMMVSEVEKTMLSQCDLLQVKYRQLFETAASEHSSENQRQRKTMYDLMARLFPISSYIPDKKKSSSKCPKKLL